MREKITDYVLPIERTPDYQNWIKTKGYISPEKYVESGLRWAITQLDYNLISEDAIYEFGDKKTDVIKGITEWLNKNKGGSIFNFPLFLKNVEEKLIK